MFFDLKQQTFFEINAQFSVCFFEKEESFDILALVLLQVSFAMIYRTIEPRVEHKGEPISLVIRQKKTLLGFQSHLIMSLGCRCFQIFDGIFHLQSWLDWR